MTNFGIDKEQALKDIRRLANATDQPFGMWWHHDKWVAQPAGTLLKVDLTKLSEFQIVRPKEDEK